MEKKLTFGRRDIFDFLSIYFCWGAGYVTSKMVVDSIPAITGAALRYGLALVVLLVVLAFMKPKLKGITLKQLRGSGILGFIFVFATMGLEFLSFETIDSSIAALIFATVPGVVIIIELFLGKKAKIAFVIASILGLIGLSITLFGYIETPLHAEQIKGTIFALAAALIWAFGTVLVTNIEQPDDLVVGMTFQIFVGSSLLAILALIIGDWGELNVSEVTNESWIALVFAAVFSSVIGFMSMLRLLKHVPASVVGTYTFVNPIVALLLGAWLLHEKLNWISLIGGGIVIFSALALCFWQIKQDNKPDPDHIHLDEPHS